MSFLEVFHFFDEKFCPVMGLLFGSAGHIPTLNLGKLPPPRPWIYPPPGESDIYISKTRYDRVMTHKTISCQSVSSFGHIYLTYPCNSWESLHKYFWTNCSLLCCDWRSSPTFYMAPKKIQGWTKVHSNTCSIPPTSWAES